MAGAALTAAAAIFQGVQSSRSSRHARRDVRSERRRQAGIVEQEKRTVTAGPADQTSEAARKNRRKSASLFTKGFTPPILGQQGLTGA